jgi:hypothetical protein
MVRPLAKPLVASLKKREGRVISPKPISWLSGLTRRPLNRFLAGFSHKQFAQFCLVRDGLIRLHVGPAYDHDTG